MFSSLSCPRLQRAAVPVFLSFFLCACGGATPESRQAASATVDAAVQPVFDATYTPFDVAGSVWDYDLLDDQGQVTGTGTMTNAVTNGAMWLTYTASILGGRTEGWEKKADGLYFKLGSRPKWTLASGVQVREFDFPDTAIGVEKRSSVSFLANDQDKDGLPEAATYDHRRTLVGFETLSIAGTQVRAARFKVVLQVTYTLSAGGTGGFEERQDLYLAPGLGVVKDVWVNRDLVAGTVNTVTMVARSIQIGTDRWPAQ